MQGAKELSRNMQSRQQLLGWQQHSQLPPCHLGAHRQYCARRLRSLYTSLKFLHGKGRYTKKKLDNVVGGDVR